MARINNTKKEVVVRSLAQIENRIHQANALLRDELDTTGKLDAGYVAGADGNAKSKVGEVIKIIRWLKEDYFGISGAPAAYTDAEMEAIDPDILTHEEDE